jgi:hypothetical protein
VEAVGGRVVLGSAVPNFVALKVSRQRLGSAVEQLKVTRITERLDVLVLGDE